MHHVRPFQFTPLREGRRDEAGGHVGRLQISIHAPPRGATHQRAARNANQDISIHAPPRGATRTWCITFFRVNFNSRPSARGDYAYAEQVKQQLQISIHAPPRGATKGQHFISCQLGISIHAPPRGATDRSIREYSRALISIHAPPRGATGDGSRKPCRASHFNSRPSARGDLSGKSETSGSVPISIHAPPRGATD